MRYPKLRELREAIKALIKGPYTIKFPRVPSIAPEKFRGKPEFYEAECVGCGACAEVCPANTIEVVDNVRADYREATRKLILRYDSCIFCGQCQANCITEKGVRLTQEYELSLFNRQEAFSSVEKKLLLCEICHGVVACEEHLIWVAQRIKEKTFANPTLILSFLKSTGLSIEEIKQFTSQGRADRMKVLCARCRREATLEK